MTALVVVMGVALALVLVLVAGLLRSHAEILRALHDLGVGLGDDAADNSHAHERRRAASSPVAFRSRPAAASTLAEGVAEPAGLAGDPAHDVVGQSPQGASVAIAVLGTGRRTLLAFLSSGCTTCGLFWRELASGGGPRALPEGVDRLVVVTRGADEESAALISRLAPPASSGVAVVMDNASWDAYGVPVTPYFVLVDGYSDVVVGEGAAKGWPQLVGLLERAQADAGPPIDLTDGAAEGAGAAAGEGGGPKRRERAESALEQAGIGAGHPSLFGAGAGGAGSGSGAAPTDADGSRR